MRSRRGFIGGMVGTTTLLAGCAGVLEEINEDETTDGSTSNPSGGSTSGGSTTGGSDGQQSTRQNVLDTTRSVSEDRYIYWSWDLERETVLEYTYSVRSGPDIDVFLMDSQGFRNYENDNGFRTYSSNSGMSGGDTGRLRPGSYYLVIDNTGAGAVAPPTNLDDDVVNVEIQVYMER